MYPPTGEARVRPARAELLPHTRSPLATAPGSTPSKPPLDTNRSIIAPTTVNSQLLLTDWLFSGVLVRFPRLRAVGVQRYTSSRPATEGEVTVHATRWALKL